MNETERDQLLIRIDERTRITDARTARIEETLGLTTERVAVLEDDMAQRREESVTLKAAVPSNKERFAVGAGFITSLAIGLWSAYEQIANR